MKNINNIIFYLILVRNYSLKSLGRVFIFPGEILFGILTSLENNQGKSIFDEDDERNMFHKNYNNKGADSFIEMKALLALIIWILLGYLLLFWQPEPIDSSNLHRENNHTYHMKNNGNKILFSGISVSYHSDGALYTRVKFHAGKKHGLAETFSSQGELISEKCFKLGVEENLNRCK